MMDNKIKNGCCYDCTLTNINTEFSEQFPVYLRGIATSNKNGVVLPLFSEAGNDVIISDIEHILEHGTELVLDEQGKPIDRPNDFNEYGIITRVAIYHGRQNSYEMMFVKNSFSNLGQLVQSMPRDKQEEVIPAILVYDASKVERVKSVEIALPHDPNLRRESLIGVYLLTSQFDFLWVERTDES